MTETKDMLVTLEDLKAVHDNHIGKLNDKVDKVGGKGLSTNDYDAAAKAKVDDIPDDPKYTDTVYDDSELKKSIGQVNSSLQGIIGNLNELNTNAKSNLVAAVNESLATSSGATRWYTVADLITEEVVNEYVASTDSNGVSIAEYNPSAIALYIAVPVDETQGTANGVHYIYPFASELDGSETFRLVDGFTNWVVNSVVTTNVFLGSVAGMVCLGNTVATLDPSGVEYDVLDGVRVTFQDSADHFPVGTHIIVSVLGVKP